MNGGCTTWIKNRAFSRVDMTKKRLLYLVLVIIISSYASACAYLYFFQRNILYLTDNKLAAPKDMGLENAEILSLETIDNLKITAWYIAPQADMPILVYFHGNAGTLNRRANKFKDFVNAGFGILAISYRGYGNSEGSPTEEGIYNDARSAINYLIKQGVKASNIVLYGESLGTGVAVQMATENNFKAVILEAPYTSIEARAAEIYPYAPIKFLLEDQFNSIGKINKINTPLLIFHSKDDKVIPIKHGLELFAIAKDPKKIIVFENYGHSKFNTKELSDLMVEFIKNIKNQ